MRRAVAGAGSDAWAAAFADHRHHLFGLCYRLTGSAADAEDLVQETFARALARPPADADRPLRPWLVRVAVNLGRDLLRRRRRRAYDGPWLPEPVESGTLLDVESGTLLEPAGTAGRYELLESVSYAFLLALEALTPTQRAVLLLRDVLDYTGPETAAALDMGEANVRQTLRRARRALVAAGAERRPPSAGLPERTAETLRRFVSHLAAGDAPAVERLLASDVVLCSDGGGEFFSARVPVVGASRVARFHLNLLRGVAQPPRLVLRELNGFPALVGEVPSPGPRIAPRFATLARLDAEGRIARIFSVLATRKLGAVTPIRDTEPLLVVPAGAGRPSR